MKVRKELQEPVNLKEMKMKKSLLIKYRFIC